MRILLTVTGLSAMAGTALADDLKLDVELPRIPVAEYHNPYVAVWISRADNSVAANLSVWYWQESGPEGEGEQWLKDIRQWWRRTGRELTFPIDGVSEPTKAPGKHKIELTDKDAPLADLAPGDYVLNVEATREVGGREHLKIPFTWGNNQGSDVSVSGSSELGEVSLKITSN